jgi:hypothetical protein
VAQRSVMSLCDHCLPNIGIQRPWKRHVALVRQQTMSLVWNGCCTAVVLFGTLYLLKICGPIRYALSLECSHCGGVHACPRSAIADLLRSFRVGVYQNPAGSAL